MTYECENCGMDFDTTAELANHKQKFCVDSKYGNPDALEKRMEELKKMEHDIDYNYEKGLSAGPATKAIPGKEANMPPSTKAATGQM